MNKSQEEWSERVAERAETYITPENPHPNYDRAIRDLTLEARLTELYQERAAQIENGCIQQKLILRCDRNIKKIIICSMK